VVTASGVRVFVVPKPATAQAMATQPSPREGRQEGGCGNFGMNESASKESPVPEGATQGSSDPSVAWPWVNRSIWSARMLAALDNGVKGNKWFSLIDKIYRPQTLAEAWQRVKRNRGAAGIDGQSIERFASREAEYLSELAQALQGETYRAQAVRRVDIPKDHGKSRPSRYLSVNLSQRVMDSVPGAAARTRCGKWTGGCRRATPTWWMPTSKATSTPSRGNA